MLLSRLDISVGDVVGGLTSTASAIADTDFGQLIIWIVVIGFGVSALIAILNAKG